MGNMVRNNVWQALLIALHVVLHTLVSCAEPGGEERDETLTIALLGPSCASAQGKYPVGPSIAGGAILAIDDINDKTLYPHLLPNHALEYFWQDSGCEFDLGLQAVRAALEKDPDVVIGPVCSVRCGCP